MAASKPVWAQSATDAALETVQKHSAEQDLKLFGSWYCPFVQRAWIALEVSGLPYQYVEVDPYAKPQALLDISPAGLVPALRHGPTWSIHESAIILEYVEELAPGLLPPADQKQARASARLRADRASSKIAGPFYRSIRPRDPEDHAKALGELGEELDRLVAAADPDGPFFAGKEFGWVDVYMAPWIMRTRTLVSLYNGPELAPESRPRWKKWADAIESYPAVKATLSDDSAYFEGLKQYAKV